MSQAVNETTQRKRANVNLIDCYRVALDFGLPVAEKAIDSLLMSYPAAGSQMQEPAGKENPVNRPG